MNKPEKPSYEFGSFQLYPADRSLQRAGVPVQLTPKMFDILLLLVERSGQLVSKDELMRAVWPDTFVEDANLTVNISSLRKALGDSGNGHQFIETVQRRGYRFGVDVKKSVGGGEVEMDALNAPAELARVTNQRAGKMTKTMASAFSALAAAIVLVIFYIFGASRWPRSASSFEAMKIARLTTSGNVAEAVISPNGKYLAYVLDDFGKRSIRVKQIAVGSESEIVSPRDLPMGRLNFSSEGNFVYFMKEEKDPQFSALYQIPVFGGDPKRIMNLNRVVNGRLIGISSGVTFSPDGAFIAFIRNNSGPKESSLLVVNSDGSNERTLAVRRLPEFFAGTPVWSPDGKTIVCPTHSNENRYNRGIVAISAANGETREINSSRWFPGQLAWLPNGSGLIFAAPEDAPESISSNSQIWRLSYPGGDARRITNDLSNYRSVSLTSEAAELVTIKQERLSNLWLVPLGNPDKARQITFSAGKREAASGIAMLPDGRIVYDVDDGAAGQRNIVSIDPDGRNSKQLTNNSQGRINLGQAVSPDGSFIVYSSATDRYHIWRMDSDGANPRQLTFGGGEFGAQIAPDGKSVIYTELNEGKYTIRKTSFDGETRQLTFGGKEIDPQVTPDGRWIVYVAMNEEKETIWKAPIDGGEATPFTNVHSARPRISPDGKMVVCYYWADWPNKEPKLAVIPFSGKGPIKILDLDPRSHQDIRWSQDSNALTYIERRAGVSNLWLRPLDGSAPRRLTNFKSDRIYNYVWSRDGGQIVCLRGVDLSDAVLISGLK